MSCQITLSTWSGESKTEAAEKLSRIFRLKKEKGLATVEGLCEGLPLEIRCIQSAESGPFELKS